MRNHRALRRERLGLSQRAVGSLVGTSQSQISRIERGRDPGCVDLIERVDAVLAAEETRRGLPPIKPPRDHRLFERRKRLGLNRAQLGELFLPVVSAAALECTVEMIESGQGSADKVQAMRRAIVWQETAPRRVREERRREAGRIAFQRSLWAALPDHPAVRALKAAMLDRCLDLMHIGSGEECDAIAEFLPEPDVGAMFEQWERETTPDTADAPVEA